MKLVLFDFDKTITKKDSFIEFLKFNYSPIIYYWKLFLLSPWIFCYLLKIISAKRLKERFLSVFFKGKTKPFLFQKGSEFSGAVIPKILNHDVYNEFLYHSKNSKVVIVSASIDIWLESWCQEHKCDLICTRLDFENDVFTGKINGKNIKGSSKREMVLKQYKTDEFDEIIVYGNKGLDNELFKLASSKNNIHAY